jgi:8-oxo-dGTP diphosphatase
MDSITARENVVAMTEEPIVRKPVSIRMAAGLLRRGDEVLLCHRRTDRDSYPDLWDLPGGHVDEREDIADALVRELTEELGIGVDRPPGTAWRVIPIEGAELHVFLVDHWVGEPSNAAVDEHDEIAWMGPRQLDDLDLADERYRTLLRDALA